MEKTSNLGRPEGGNYRENVRLNRKKAIKINPDYVKPDVRIKAPTNAARKYYCCMCGNDYTTQKGNFVSGGKSLLWQGNNGYLPFCKSCCEILMQSLTSFYSGNEEHALRHLCATFDLYYSEDASAMTLTQVHATKSRITTYPAKTNTRQVSKYGETYLDTVRDEVKEHNQLIDANQITAKSEIEEGEEEFEVTREMIRTWGKGLTPDQYQFLEEEYADWVAKNVCNTKAQEELFRNLAYAQLDIRMARQNGGDVDKAQKMMQGLMNSANILPKQTADNLLADTQTFGTLLRKFEETSPVPEPSPEWRDVDGIRRYMNTWFRGGLAKALKINNENAALYEDAVEEMRRYTVQPAAAPSDEVSNDASIFDKAEGGEQNG